MFDKRRERSVDSAHFGVRGTGGRQTVRVLLLLALATIWVCGCSPRRVPETAEDSLTSGRITVVCAPEVSSIITREVATFDSLYPAAHVAMRVGSSREAVRALFAAECDLAVITRDLEPDERRAAVGGGLALEGYGFARDGVAIIVHPSNRLENIALEEVRDIYLGVVGRWDSVGGNASAIEPVIQAPDSDLLACFEQRVMNGQPIQARVVYEDSDSGVVAFVSRHPGAIGFVSMAWADRGAKALRIAALKGLAYRGPDAERVYRGEYPLTRAMTLVVRPKGRALANGLVTFITSMEGQKLVHEGGLVPTAVPIRFVRRSAMLGSH